MERQTGDLTRFGRRQSCGGQCGEEAGDTYEAWGLVGGGQGERKRDSMALRPAPSPPPPRNDALL